MKQAERFYYAIIPSHHFPLFLLSFLTAYRVPVVAAEALRSRQGPRLEMPVSQRRGAEESALW